MPSTRAGWLAGCLAGAGELVRAGCVAITPQHLHARRNELHESEIHRLHAWSRDVEEREEKASAAVASGGVQYANLL